MRKEFKKINKHQAACRKFWEAPISPKVSILPQEQPSNAKAVHLNPLLTKGASYNPKCYTHPKQYIYQKHIDKWVVRRVQELFGEVTNRELAIIAKTGTSLEKLRD